MGQAGLGDCYAAKTAAERIGCYLWTNRFGQLVGLSQGLSGRCTSGGGNSIRLVLKETTAACANGYAVQYAEPAVFQRRCCITSRFLPSAFSTSTMGSSEAAYIILGHHHISVGEVAVSYGVSRGTIYNYRAENGDSRTDIKALPISLVMG